MFYCVIIIFFAVLHQADKVARSAIGDLVRTRNKIPVNPFEACQALLKKMRENATYFSYATRLKDSWALDSVISGGVAHVRFKTDFNGTRVAAQHMLLFSVLRLNKALQIFSSINKPSFALSPEEWESITEIEAVMKISVKKNDDDDDS